MQENKREEEGHKTHLIPKYFLLFDTGGKDLRWPLIPRRNPGRRKPTFSRGPHCNAVPATCLRRMKTPIRWPNVIGRTLIVPNFLSCIVLYDDFQLCTLSIIDISAMITLPSVLWYTFATKDEHLFSYEHFQIWKCSVMNHWSLAL